MSDRVEFRDEEGCMFLLLPIVAAIIFYLLAPGLTSADGPQDSWASKYIRPSAVIERRLLGVWLSHGGLRCHYSDGTSRRPTGIGLRGQTLCP